MKKLKSILFVIILLLTMSCVNDDELNLSDKLVGEWIRCDSCVDFEFKLIFNPNNSGYKMIKNGDEKTRITSSAIQFDWSTFENLLSINEFDKISTTRFLLNKKGQLILTDYSDVPFDRVLEN